MQIPAPPYSWPRTSIGLLPDGDKPIFHCIVYFFMISSSFSHALIIGLR